MKIVLADGTHAADYIIKNFSGHGNKIIAINSKKEDAVYLSKTSGIPVISGKPWSQEILQNANVKGADIFMALGFCDTDNYVSCMLAKTVFDVKKVICIVTNPKNVELYRRLGIDAVISSTQLLASSIVAESSLEDLIRAVSLEDDKIVMTEIIVKDTYEIAHKRISEISFPKTGNISCIYRKPNVIIAKGQTMILPKDKMIVVSTKADQQEIIDFIQKPISK